MSFAGFGFGMLTKLATNASDIWGTGNKLRDDKREEANEDFLYRERMGIQSRVEGAKAAGIHPLAAMGYQGGNAPMQVIGDSSPPQVSYSGGGGSEKRDPNIDRINAANARRSEAEADMAELAAHNAYRNLANQPGNPPPASMPTSPANLSGAGMGAGLKPGVVLKPDEVTAGVGGLTAGTHPGATDVIVPGYGNMRVPSGKLKEALEDNELASTAMLLALNRSRWWKYLTDDLPAAILPPRKSQMIPIEEDPEVRRLRLRHPPKGDYYISPRSRGGVVR